MRDEYDAKMDYVAWRVANQIEDTPEIEAAFYAGHEYARDRAEYAAWETNMGDDL